MMRRTNILFFLSLIIFAEIVLAQTQDSLSAELLFFRARELAFNNQRDSARVLLLKALEKDPQYADIRILLGRTYAWDHRYSEARSELKIVIEKFPKYLDAYYAAMDVEIWDAKPAEALKLCMAALQYHPNDELLLVKRATLFRDLNRMQEALLTVAILEEINRSNPNIPSIRESISEKGFINSVTASYSYDLSSAAPRPNQVMSISYGRTISGSTVFGKVNIADRAKQTAMQFELEAYSTLTSGIYSYINYGFSDTTSAVLFPAHRLGLELFFSLPANFEGSIGSRHLFYSSKPKNVYTVSGGYYFQNYWFSLRSFITPGGVSFSRSLTGMVRWYFGDEGNYISGRAGGGISPDEDRFVDTVGAQLYGLAASLFGVGCQYAINPAIVLNTTIDYTSQELAYRRGNFTNVYSAFLSLKYKF